jgi:beta-lactam-binding protein with PASTA domain
MACDPNFSDVALLLHMDGTNGSTSFPDDGPSGLTVTPTNVTVDTASPEFGTGAALFNVGQNKLLIPSPNGSPMDLTQQGDFTVEGWFKIPAYPTTQGLMLLWSTLGTSISNTTWARCFVGTAGQVTFQIVGTAGGIPVSPVSTTGAIAINTWTHVACVRSGGTFYIFVGGQLLGGNATETGTNTGSMGAVRDTQFAVGWDANAPVQNIYLIGQADEFRVTANFARYTANFTPAGPFGGTCAIIVPNVTGQALATAETNLTAVGLVIGSVTQTSDPVINSGFVILTAPSAGASAMVGDTVDITESNSETVPNVNGDLLATGESAITGAGFTVGTVTQTTDPVINNGFIIGTTPAGGTRATAGSAVDISESNSATVPNVVGVPLASAETDITSAGLTVGTVTTQFSLLVPGGDIISSNPAAGVRTVAGTSVDLLESSGPGVGTVPDVLNTSETLAEAAIIAAGFVVGTVSFQSDAIIIAGNVDAQSPAGGASAFLASPVNITISTGLPSLRVPDLFGLTQAAATLLLQSLGLVVGAVGFAPSKLGAPNTIITQNPSAGTPVAAGSVVSFVISLGVLAVGEIFDFEATVISQYANSPTILQLANNMNLYVDQSANFADFYNFVWNVDTAVGFGLDIWGKIVGVSRLLQIPNTTDYVGFFIAGETTQDWQPMGSDQPPQPAVGGAMYTGHNATETYLLDDDAYRQLILAKAFANIAATTAPAINQILQNLYGSGTAFVLNTGPMSISYNLTFTPTAIQLAILQQSGVIPTPPGVSFVINTDV